MSKTFTPCCSLDEAKAVREEVAFMQAVKVASAELVLEQAETIGEDWEH